MHCDVCGFNSGLWSISDVLGTLEEAVPLARHVMDSAPLDVAADMARLLAPLSDLIVTDPTDAVHLVMHQVHLAGRLRHLTTAPESGYVAQINVGAGGVPKQPVDRATVSVRGVEADAQHDRRHHGRPWQALCLWSAEIIEGLQADGHPIDFGCAGENLTVRGLDWKLLSPGVRLLVGTALLQVCSYATPCAKNARWFTDGDVSRMAQEARPGRSRLYASVLREGIVATGDTVTVEPLDRPSQARPPEQQTSSL
jgi:MOSC domain-containing protein YiiM